MPEDYQGRVTYFVRTLILILLCALFTIYLLLTSVYTLYYSHKLRGDTDD